METVLETTIEVTSESAIDAASPISAEPLTDEAVVVPGIESPSLDIKAKPQKVSTDFDFICSTKQLRDALDSAARAVSSRPSHPVLANVRFTVEGGLVFVDGFDLSLGIRVWFGAQVNAEGAITLPARFLKDVISKLPVGDVRLKQKGLTVEITQGKSKFKVSGLDVDEFPDLPEIDASPISIDAESLTDLIEATLYANSADETKQILTGTRITILPDKIEAGATDGHRLAVRTVAVESSVADEFGVTVPARALAELKTLLGKADTETVEVFADDTQIKFALQGALITSRLLEGQYPRYQQLIPRQFTTEIIADVKSLLGAIQRCALVAEYKNRIVEIKVDAKDQLMVFSVDAGDYAAREEVPAQISGDGLNFACNIRYLLDALQVGSSECVISLNSPTAPLVIKPLDASAQIALLMPVQVREK